MKKILLITAVSISLASEGVAQDRQGPRNAEEAINRIFEKDTDKDGKLSADELGSRAQRLMSMDSDGDGFLSKDEFKTMMDRRLSGRGQRGQDGQDGVGGRGGRGGAGGAGGAGGGRGGPGGSERMAMLLASLPIMKALDADGNGELSKQEIENAVKALNSLDKDNSGTVTAQELMPDMSQLLGRGGRGGRGGAGGGRGGAGGGRRGGPGGRPQMDDDN